MSTTNKFIELTKDQTKAQLEVVLRTAGRNPRYSGRTLHKKIERKNGDIDYKVERRPGFYVD